MRELVLEGPEQPDPLRIESIDVPNDDDPARLLFTFNRAPDPLELGAMRRLPPSHLVADDARRFAERTILSELAVRLFRVLVLGNVVLPDTPAAMDWLKDWIDGVNHGPVGQGPMVWPEKLIGVCNLLRGWGFQPTPTVPPYVMRQPAKRETVN